MAFARNHRSRSVQDLFGNGRLWFTATLRHASFLQPRNLAHCASPASYSIHQEYRSRMRRTAPILLSALLLLPATAFARWHHWHHGHRLFPASAALPNSSRTPGALNPAVTQRDIYSTICVRGWTRTVRPPEAYTERLKREQIRLYGYRDGWLRDYEEDHLLCRVSELLRTGTTLGNSRREPRRDTKSVARTAGFPIRDNG